MPAGGPPALTILYAPYVAGAQCRGTLVHENYYEGGGAGFSFCSRSITKTTWLGMRARRPLQHFSCFGGPYSHSRTRPIRPKLGAYTCAGVPSPAGISQSPNPPPPPSSLKENDCVCIASHGREPIFFFSLLAWRLYMGLMMRSKTETGMYKKESHEPRRPRPLLSQKAKCLCVCVCHFITMCLVWSGLVSCLKVSGKLLVRIYLLSCLKGERPAGGGGKPADNYLPFTRTFMLF